MASQGWSYRGSTGFGLEFQELIKKDGWGGKEQEDILEGIKALIKDEIAEQFKVGMTDLVVDYNTTRPDLRVYGEEMMGWYCRNTLIWYNSDTTLCLL